MHNTSVLIWPQLLSILNFEVSKSIWDNLDADDSELAAFRLAEGKKANILLSMAVVCEGFLKTVIQYHLLSETTNPVSAEEIENVSSLTWSRLHGEFNRRFPRRFKDYCNDEDVNLYDDLEHLFKVRNLLGHGQEIAFSYQRESNGDFTILLKEGKMEKVITYLKSRGVLDNDELSNLGLLYNENVIKFFFRSFQIFLNHSQFRAIPGINALFESVYSSSN